MLAYTLTVGGFCVSHIGGNTVGAANKSKRESAVFVVYVLIFVQPLVKQRDTSAFSVDADEGGVRVCFIIFEVAYLFPYNCVKRLSGLVFVAHYSRGEKNTCSVISEPVVEGDVYVKLS